MDPKTMLSCQQGRSGRHRLTIPKHTIKALARKLAFEAQRGLKPTRKDAKKRKKAQEKEVGRIKVKATARRKLTPALPDSVGVSPTTTEISG